MFGLSPKTQRRVGTGLAVAGISLPVLAATGHLLLGQPGQALPDLVLAGCLILFVRGVRRMSR
jgi:hypothetical protein